MSVFSTLNAINVNDHTENKNGLTYLSWAWAWSKVKEYYPEAYYTIYENAEGFNYHHDSKTCWVKTGVTIEGIEHIEYLPVMDYRNKSIPVDNVTSFDVNKAIQRSLTKAAARHGLGLYIYAGEDLPESEVNAKEVEKESIINNISLAIIELKSLDVILQDEGVHKWILKAAKVKNLDYPAMNNEELKRVLKAMDKLISEKKKQNLLGEPVNG